MTDIRSNGGAEGRSRDPGEPADDALAARLRESLASALTAPLPRDLVPATIDAVHETRQERSTFRLAGLLAAAAVLVAAFGIALVGFRGAPGPGATALPSPPAVSIAPGTSSPSPSLPAASSATAGLPVISVAEAVAIRDDPTRTTPERLAVAGWYQPAPPVPCPAPASGLAALVPRCPDSFAALMQSPQVLNHVNPDGSGSWSSPFEPYLTPRFLAGIPGSRSTAWNQGPFLVVFIGHFHDPAAAACRPADRTICDQQFVVDEVAPLAAAVPAPVNDPRLDCHTGACVNLAAQVAVVAPEAYAAAARVAFPTACPPWMACPRPSAIVALVPSGWIGDAASLSAWQTARPSASGPMSIEPLRAIDDYMLIQAAGYAVTCYQGAGATCDAQAVAIARRDAHPLEIATIAITDACGSGTAQRRDGSAAAWQADCAAPGQLSPVPSPSAGASVTFPDQVDGMQVISVGEAIRLRDSASWAGAALVAVRGWYTPATPLSCPWTPGTDALERPCPDGFAYLADSSERLVTTAPDSISAHAPSAPWLNPRFIGAAMAPVTSPPGTLPDYTPVPIVVVGHFGDGRASYCTDGNAVACAAAFVVDGVRWADGRWLDPVAVAAQGMIPLDTVLTSTPAEVAATIRRAYSPSTGWTVEALRPAAGSDLAWLDPRTLVVPGMSSARAAWIIDLVRFGGSPPVVPETRTVIAVDGTSQVVTLPPWPDRLALGQRLPTAAAVGGPDGARATCVGVAPADCLTATTRVAAADHPAGATAGQWVVVPACPPWSAWSDPIAGTVRMVAALAPQGNQTQWTRTYLVAASGAVTALQPTAITPAWLERAIYQAQGGQ